MSKPGASSDVDDLRHEQEYVSMLYGRLDEMRERATDRLARSMRQTGGTPAARSERDAAAGMYGAQIATYGAVEHGLAFGRLDFDDDSQRYIGRIGIFDEDNEYEPLLMDWRAPAARPFYLATAASPEGVRRRRYLKLRLRDVVRLDDDVLDLSAADASQPSSLTGEAALLAAVTAGRTGRMGDIVATIQGEQDRIIRAGHDGILVVQGGPGTGKTAVALHRAAYLLYTHREQLARSGVLIVGPNLTFLSYIGQVLPSLGETGALLCTMSDLLPGVTATGVESAAVAEIKGRLDMAAVISAAVRNRQSLPRRTREIVVDRETLLFDRNMAAQARTRARRARRPHNEARRYFVRTAIDLLARQLSAKMGKNFFGEGSLLDPTDIEAIRAELRTDPAVQQALAEYWPDLTPQRLLSDLYADPERLAAATPNLTPAERELLHRRPGSAFTAADVPLLDEAAELLGEDASAARAREKRERRERVEFAQGVLDTMEGSASFDFEEEESEILTATDLIDAEMLAERHEYDVWLTAAERAALDRSWTFGHVIVDEAQELSEMAWRSLMRRCPSRSMTLVGDVAQTGELAGVSSWSNALERYQGDRWRVEQLTVNYRTPAEIMSVATDVLAEIDPSLEPPKSVRESGVLPWARQADDLSAAVAEAVAVEEAAVAGGRVAVLVPTARMAELGGFAGNPDLERTTVVLTVRQAKGLEFDSVLVVDPAGILAESPRGLNDLYVALTRATQRLGVLHPGELPEVLARLSS